MPSSSPAFTCDTLTRSKILVASCRSATNALRGIVAVEERVGCVIFHKRQQWKKVLRELVQKSYQAKEMQGVSAAIK